MSYFIIDTVKLKLYTCNNVDDLLMQMNREVNLGDTVEEPLVNIIFNPRVFNTNEKLTKLKNALEAFICQTPIKGEKKIDASTRNQYFYLYAPLWSLPDVLADDSMVNFIRQMALWFPERILSDKKEQRNYEQSLFHEKKKWEKKDQLLKVTQWKSFIKESSMSVKKATHFESLAMKVYTTVNVLLKDMLRENH